MSASDPLLFSLPQQHALWLLADPIHALLSNSMASLPLLHDEWCGRGENRQWSFFSGSQLMPVARAIRDLAPAGRPATRFLVLPIPLLPVSTHLYLNPHVSLKLRSAFSLEDSPSLSHQLLSNSRFLLTYRGFLSRRDLSSSSSLSSASSPPSFANSDATFSLGLGASARSFHAEMLMRLNPTSFGWSDAFPLYFSASSTAEAHADQLSESLLSVALHARPVVLFGPHNFVSLEVKRDQTADDNRWYGKLVVKQQFSDFPPPLFVQQLLQREQAVQPSAVELQREEQPSNAAVMLQEATDALTRQAQLMRDRTYELLDEASRRARVVFPDLFDQPAPPSPFYVIPPRAPEPPALSFPRWQRIPYPRPPAQLLPLPFRSSLSVGVTAPVGFIPHSVRSDHSYRLGDSPLSHRMREVSVAVGMMVQPFPTHPEAALILEHYQMSSARATMLTARSTVTGGSFFFDIGLVKQSHQANSQLHCGFGFALGDARFSG